MKLSERFRGYLPVVVDLETGGFDRSINPILQIACTFLTISNDDLVCKDHADWAVEPFADGVIDPASLKVTKIDLDDPERQALPEREALNVFFKAVRDEMRSEGCHRAVMVAHNASFDQGFLNTACERVNLKRNPFHPFTAIDTASLSALAFGHTVLSEACRRAGLEFTEAKAHNAAYDVERTAALFCQVVNSWDSRIGSPLTDAEAASQP